MRTPPPASIKTKGALNHPVPKLMQTTSKRIKNKENNIWTLGPLSLIFERALRQTCQLYSLFLLLYTVCITIWHNNLRSPELCWMCVVDSRLGDCGGGVVVVAYYCLTLMKLSLLHLQLQFIYQFVCVSLYSVHIMYNVCIHTPVAIKQFIFFSSFCCRQ